MMAQAGGRPRTVTVAAALTAAVAIGYLATGVAMAGQVGGARTRARHVFAQAGIDPDTLGGLQVFASRLAYVFVAITIAAGLLLLVAAAALRSGSRAGRAFAWLVMALTLLCGFSALSQSGTAEFAGVAQVTTYSFDGDRIRQMDRALPATFGPGYRIAAGTFSVLALVALAAAIVLLAQRSAIRYVQAAGSSPDRAPASYPDRAPAPYPDRELAPYPDREPSLSPDRATAGANGRAMDRCWVRRAGRRPAAGE
jgi:hypothetical protein